MVGNAIKFTHQGEVVMRVAPIRQEEREYLEFSVRDTGIGIPPEKQGRIFDAFAQADASTTRKYGGTGLGLTISARLVTLMGGRIWIESDAGRGATFHFTIPFARTEGPVRDAPVFRQAAGMRVLVVDDNETSRGLAARKLREWNIEATTAGSAEEAMEYLARLASVQAACHLALVDFEMPDVNGLELAGRIRSQFESAIPIVLMLGSVESHAAIAHCGGLRIDGYLVKPVRHMAMAETVQRSMHGPVNTWSNDAANYASEPVASVASLKILLAEDNAVNQRVTSSLLERQGHTVTVAEHGRQAVEIFRERGFDLVLMDIQMPEMNGFEATRAIRAWEASRGTRTPIVALTAHAMKGDDERCLAAGMDGHLAKPIRSAELQRALSEFAGARVG